MAGQASREIAARVTERWAPDEQLIAAVCSGGGRHRMADLAQPDRCWLVAGLTLAGMTAEDIRDRLSCSLRLVRAIRAEPMTQLCLVYQREVDHFANEMRLAAAGREESARQLAIVAAERDKAKEQLDRVLDARLVGEQIDVCGKGHLMTPWNTYWKRGRRWCRECHADRQRDYRLAKKLGVSAQQIREARDAGHLDDLTRKAVAVQTVLRAASTPQLSQHAPTG